MSAQFCALNIDYTVSNSPKLALKVGKKFFMFNSQRKTFSFAALTFLDITCRKMKIRFMFTFEHREACMTGNERILAVFYA